MVDLSTSKGTAVSKHVSVFVIKKLFFARKSLNENFLFSLSDNKNNIKIGGRIDIAKY